MTTEEMIKYNKTVEYRQKIMETLLSSEILPELCKNRPVDEEEVPELIWKNYLPKLFVDGTITDKEAYILFDFDIYSNRVNTYDNVTFYIQIFCSKDIVRLDNGMAVRTDAIVAELNRLLDGKNVLGIGYNNRVYEKIIESPNNQYIATQLCYKVVDFNEKSVIRAKNH
ncbi:MAG: hypothetical protein MJ126_04445 [Lachnospiraceae bacterium]|nr:hypothetical protein [Lachnospiraceae bacterium]